MSNEECKAGAALALLNERLARYAAYPKFDLWGLLEDLACSWDRKLHGSRVELAAAIDMMANQLRELMKGHESLDDMVEERAGKAHEQYQLLILLKAAVEYSDTTAMNFPWSAAPHPSNGGRDAGGAPSQ